MDQHVFGVVVEKRPSGEFLARPDTPVSCNHKVAIGREIEPCDHLIHGFLIGGRFINDGEDAPIYGETCNRNFSLKITSTPSIGTRILMTVVQDGDKYVAKFWALETAVFDSIRRIEFAKEQAEKERQRQERMRLREEAKVAREQMLVDMNAANSTLGSSLSSIIAARPNLAQQPVAFDSSDEQVPPMVIAASSKKPQGKHASTKGAREAAAATPAPRGKRHNGSTVPQHLSAAQA